MSIRWFASLAALVAMAGLTPAQAPSTSGKSASPSKVIPQSFVATEPTYPVSTSVDPGAGPKTSQPFAPPSLTDAPCDGCGDAAGAIWGPRDYVNVSRRAWLQAEYLLWFINDGELPRVVGTAPVSEVVGTGGGDIQTITSLYGDGVRSLSFDDQSGVRITAGFYLDEEECFGVEGSWFQLEDGSQFSQYSSAGNPIIGPTFFDPVQGRDIIVLASLPFIPAGDLAPGLRAARIDVTGSNSLWGFEVNGRSRLSALLFADRLELIAGYRYLQYEESLAISTLSQPLPGNPGAFTLGAFDSFSTCNEFHGGQIGLSSRTYICPRVTLDLTAKIGLGNMRQNVDINGTTILAAPGIPTTVTPGGILAQPTNMRGFTRDNIAMVNELTATAGFHLARGVRLGVGYNFLYVGRIQRASDQIDAVDSRAVQALASYDPTVVTTRPGVLRDNTSRLWVHGINAVIEFAY